MSDMSLSSLSSVAMEASRPSPEASRDKLALLNLTGGGKTATAMDSALGEFQNMLVKEMVKTMRASVPESTLFKKSSGEKIFESMLDEKYAESFGGEGGSLGLTEAIKQQFEPPRSCLDRPKEKTQAAAVSHISAIPNILTKGDNHSE